MNIQLREICRDDLREINKWRNDESLVELLGSPFRYIGLDVDVEWYNQYLQSRAKNIRLAICESEKIIGMVNLLSIDWVSRNAEFSIMVGAPEMRQHGCGSQAARLMLSHAFFDMNLHRVYLTVLADNKPAQKLYKKIGFVYEGMQRQHLYKKGEYRDLVCMAILREEYGN